MSVSTENNTSPSVIPISTILVKRTAFTAAEIERFMRNVDAVPGTTARHAPDRQLEDSAVDKILSLDQAALEKWYEAYPYDVSPISDDSPFFWHFARFRTVLASFTAPLGRIDLEDSVGERVLLLMVLISVLFG